MQSTYEQGAQRRVYTLNQRACYYLYIYTIKSERQGEKLTAVGRTRQVLYSLGIAACVPCVYITLTDVLKKLLEIMRADLRGARASTRWIIT